METDKTIRLSLLRVEDSSKLRTSTSTMALKATHHESPRKTLRQEKPSAVEVIKAEAVREKPTANQKPPNSHALNGWSTACIICIKLGMKWSASPHPCFPTHSGIDGPQDYEGAHYRRGAKGHCRYYFICSLADQKDPAQHRRRPGEWHATTTYKSSMLTRASLVDCHRFKSLRSL